MDAVLVEAPLVSRDRLRELGVRSDGASARRLFIQTLIYVASTAALVLVPNPYARAALLLVNGVIQFAMFGVLHEACHKTAFATPWLNQLAGWIAALAQPMSPALMAAFHFAHHRHTHELEHDPELGGLEMMVHWPRGVVWLVTMTGAPLVFARFGWTLFAALTPVAMDGTWTKVLPFVRPERRRRVKLEALILVAIHGGAMAVAALVLPALWWAYAGLWLGHTFLAWYTTCEHRGLAMEGTVLERTRSLVTPAWLRWLIWNMPYHAEHHGWPAIPWHALPTLHAEVRPHLVHVARPRDLHRHGGRELGSLDSGP